MEIMVFFEVMMVLICSSIIAYKLTLRDVLKFVPFAFFNFLIIKEILYDKKIASLFFIILVSLLYKLLIQRIDIKRSIIYTVIALFITILSELLALLLAIFLSIFLKIDLTEIQKVFVYIFWALSIFLLIRIPRKKIALRSIESNGINIIFNLSICILLIIIKMKVIYVKGILFNMEYISVLIIFLVFTIYVSLSYKSIILEVKEKDKLLIENSFKEVIEDNIKALRAKEHEYKNHLTTIYSMILVENHEDLAIKAKEYIKCLKDNESIDKLLYIENTILKAIIYSKLCEMEEKKIRFKFDVRSNLNNTQISSTDLAVILNNIINNAIEATLDSSNPYIYLEITDEKINLVNTFNKSQDIKVNLLSTRGYSTKGDNRGFGLYNIKNIINKINGKFLLDVSEDKFNITIFIN